MLAGLLKRLLSRRLGRATRFADVHALYERGDLEHAARACGAIADAGRADVCFLEGLIARKRRSFARAAECMRAAVELRPQESAFRIGLAQVLLDLQQADAALEHIDAVLRGRSVDASTRVAALREAANAHLSLDQLSRASERLREALELAPNDGALADLLSTTLYRDARTDEARAMLAVRVAASVPGAALRRALFLPPVYESQAQIDEVRERFSAELDAIIASPGREVDDAATQIGATAFYLSYHNRNNAALLAKVCRATRSVYRVPVELAKRRRERARRIRVGFVSTFFYMHSVGRTTIGLIRDLPRDRFSAHVFSIQPRHDALQRAIEALADDYVELDRELEKIKRTIADAALDVLVFADVGMDPLTYALALSRLAPVQAATWGHSDTSGVDTIDYYLSADAVEIASAQSHYSEALVRPRAFFLPGYARPALARRMTREELGLDAGARLYACLQPEFKLHPDFDAVLAALLERDARAEILLLAQTPTSAAFTQARLARALGAASARVRFLGRMPFERYIATLAASDVALDPLYFGGCNSSCEALALGVPVVTLPGEHLYGRFTLGLYLEMGVDRCVARTAEEYVDVATRIAGERDLRDSLSRELAERSQVLFDRRDITLAYADFFQSVVESRA